MHQHHKMRKDKPFHPYTSSARKGTRTLTRGTGRSAGTVPTEAALKLLSDFAQSNGARRRGPAVAARPVFTRTLSGTGLSELFLTHWT